MTGVSRTAQRDVPATLSRAAQPVPDRPGDTFALRLRRHRHAAGLTMEELAEASGVSARAISDMERGRSAGPQRRTVQALAEALGLTPAEQPPFLAAARAGRKRRGSPVVPAGRCAPPRPVADFTGRGRELARLAHDAASARPGAAAPVVMVSGTAGTGKTALAVQAAHVLGEMFTGGAFFLDLRGMDARPMGAGEALTRLLGALGVRDDEIPVSEADRAGMYRLLLRGRRALVVLDNAADEAQIRPLLPATGPSLTVITSRRLLAGLEGVHRLNLGPLPAEDAEALLRRILGRRGQEGDADALGEVVELCGRLPLALRIAGNRLNSRPPWTVGHLADRLRDESRRLDQLVAGDLRVAAAFGLSYARLSAPARVLFRRLSLVAAPDFDARLASALGPPGVEDAIEDALEELVESSLLHAEVDGRYRFHRLVRLFARQRLVEEEPAFERHTARRRTEAAGAFRRGRGYGPRSPHGLGHGPPAWRGPGRHGS
ncbi:helix-turn-helix domain-containing protein [Actinoplanes sp. NPDC023936]|uniref:helix-turn-helix domain-containing protein n=1 Tax=Actinoplanes sp. NPDC023936 TaxID=3154910 RepID=UPI0033E5FFCE